MEERDRIETMATGKEGTFPGEALNDWWKH
jgi:hypothetical protein